MYQLNHDLTCHCYLLLFVLQNGISYFKFRLFVYFCQFPIIYITNYTLISFDTNTLLTRQRKQYFNWQRNSTFPHAQNFLIYDINSTYNICTERKIDIICFDGLMSRKSKLAYRKEMQQ